MRIKLGKDTEPDAMDERLRARAKNIPEPISKTPIEASTFPNSEEGYSLMIMSRFLLVSLNISIIPGETRIPRRGKTRQDGKRGKCWECVKCGTGKGQEETGPQPWMHFLRYHVHRGHCSQASYDTFWE